MSATYQIVDPEETENIVRNPSAEFDLTDWTAQGSAISRTTDHARFGWYSVHVVTNGAILHEGVNIRSYPNTSDEYYAGSTYILGSGRLRLRIRDNTNGDEYYSDSFNLSPIRWTRITDIVVKTGVNICNDLRIHIETVNIEVVDFWVDGVLIENKPYSTTYIDGDQPGGRWNIARHASTSSRYASHRLGGRYIDLDEETIGLYATVTAGIGMPPLRHNIQGMALQPGVEFQSTKVLPRIIQITLWIKNPHANPGALNKLHEVRQTIIDLLKPDRTFPQQHFRLRYNGGSIPLDIDCVYEGGLEFDGDIRNSQSHSFTIRALATDPYWMEDNQQITSLDSLDIIQAQNGLLGKIDGEWNNLGFVNGYVVCLKIGPDGCLYAGGSFTVIGGVGANRIARFDGENWYPLGAGLDNVCNAIDFGPDDNLYAAGSFTSAGGVANTRAIAMWDGAAWNSVGGGLDNSAFSIAFSPNGSFYIVGNFINADPAGAPVTVNRVACWTGVSWQALIDTDTGLGNGLDAGGLEVDVAADERVYVGGAFTAAGGVANTNYIARWDPIDQTWNSIGNANNNVSAIAITVDGIVYAGGLFTNIGGVSADRAARWNGSSWAALSGGVSSQTRWIEIDQDGLVWFVGDFTGALDSDGLVIPNTDHIAIWNGYQWMPAPIMVNRDFAIGLVRMRTVVSSGEDIYFGGEGLTSTVLISAPTTFNNLSTAESYPIIRFTRALGTEANIILILNEDSGKQMDLIYEISDGEEVIIDFRPGHRTISSGQIEGDFKKYQIDIPYRKQRRKIRLDKRRNKISTIIPGSDFATWSLLPGENTISVFVQVIGNSTVTCFMRWQPIHWSVDAAVI